MTTATAKKKFYLGTGRRKTAVARVRVCDGAGKVEINDRPLDNYFTEVKDRNAVLAALVETENVGKLDVFVNVDGGGYSGQAGAICQGVARALKTMYTPPASAAPAEPVEAPPVAEGETPAAPTPPPPPPMVKKLRDSGLLTRDARMKERKKYGRRGARKGFQFSKR